MNDPPRGWDAQRIQGYFVWSKFVVDELAGTNEELEKQLDELFCGTFADPSDPSERHPCIPAADLDIHLQMYYESMNE